VLIPCYCYGDERERRYLVLRALMVLHATLSTYHSLDKRAGSCAVCWFFLPRFQLIVVLYWFPLSHRLRLRR
jgi:hypothetical protein